MSSSRKVLKIFSLAQVVIAVISLVLGAITLAGAGGATGDPVNVLGSELDPIVFATLVGVLIDLSGLLTLITAVLGIRGANRPSRLGSHRLFSLLAALASLVAMFIGSNFGSLTTPTVTMVAFALAVFAAVFDTRVRRELDR